MNKYFSPLYLLISLTAIGSASAIEATNLAQSFPVGKGSEFKMEVTGQGAVSVSIYVTAAGQNTVSLEYFIESKETMIQMWQQFQIKIEGQAKVTDGYVYTKDLKAPEKMTDNYLKGFDGVQVNDFLFSDQKTLDKNKVGEETVNIPAGDTTATHYRTTDNGQTVDYWISADAKPIGLVKLTSKGKTPNQNYTLGLVSLMNNVKATIEPAKSVPLTDKGKAFLASPASVH